MRPRQWTSCINFCWGFPWLSMPLELHPRFREQVYRNLCGITFAVSLRVVSMGQPETDRLCVFHCSSSTCTHSAELNSRCQLCTDWFKLKVCVPPHVQSMAFCSSGPEKCHSCAMSPCQTVVEYVLGRRWWMSRNLLFSFFGIRWGQYDWYLVTNTLHFSR